MAGTLEYDTNNSGGGWWLKDDDWVKLEEAGWEVLWGGRMDAEYGQYTKEDAPRWLGGLAVEARKRFDSLVEGIKEWEAITGQDAGELGCTCCGPPHNFEWTNEDGTKIRPSHIVESHLEW